MPFILYVNTKHLLFLKIKVCSVKKMINITFKKLFEQFQMFNTRKNNL